MTTIRKSGKDTIELSIVMPCLNEERTVGNCVQQAKSFFKESKVNGEVIVADNGSTDNSVEVAEKNGARVVRDLINLCLHVP